MRFTPASSSLSKAACGIAEQRQVPTAAILVPLGALSSDRIVEAKNRGNRLLCKQGRGGKTDLLFSDTDL